MQRFTSIQNRYAAQVTKFAKVGITLSAALNFFVVSAAQAITVAPGAATVSSAPRSSAATVAPRGNVLIPAAPTTQPATTTTTTLQAPPTVLGAPVPYPFAMTGACGVPAYPGAYPGAPYSGAIGGLPVGTTYSLASTVPGAYSAGCIAAPPPVNPAAVLAVAAAGCSLAAGAIGLLTGTSPGLNNAVNSYNDSLGNQPEPSWSGASNQATAAALGRIVTNAKGCSNFVNAAGEPGPWGRNALIQIRANKDAFDSIVPRDINRICPGFTGFDPTKKEMFYLNIFSAMASPESSCNPNEINPHGTNRPAIGLFQLDAIACGHVNMPSANLLNPDDNTTCAVNVFANELRNRGSIMSNCSALCSNPKDATYWAPLRSDGHDAGNTRANDRFQTVAKQFPGCGG